MKTEIIQSLTSTFAAHAQQTDAAIEFWLARDLQYLLGYTERRNFSNTLISKAKTACELSGHSVADHFVGINKTIDPYAVGRIVPAGREQSMHCRKARHEVISAAIDERGSTVYRSRHIRPMVLRPLDHPERWPTPWGFFFSGSQKLSVKVALEKAS